MIDLLIDWRCGDVGKGKPTWKYVFQ